MKIISVLIIFIMLSSFVISHSDGPIAIDESEIIGTDLPSFARSLFGNQRMNIYITLENSDSEVHGLVTENGVVTRFTDIELSNPTVNVYSSEEVIVNILSSDDSVNMFKEALDNGDITYTAIGFINRIKFSFVSAFVRMASLFSVDSTTDNKQSTSTLTGSNVVEINENDEHEVLVNNVKEEVMGKDIEDIIDDVHVIKLTNDGFSPDKLTIKNGDKVIWKNERNGNFNKAMIIGVRSCRDVKSKTFSSGESYEYIFNNKGTCTIVDGMMTQLESKIHVR